MLEYRYLQPEDAKAAAEVHVEGQPGTVLTMLGQPFLEELYRAVCCSEWGEGITTPFAGGTPLRCGDDPSSRAGPSVLTFYT